MQQYGDDAAVEALIRAQRLGGRWLGRCHERVAVSDFDKAVAEEYRAIKQQVENRPVIDRSQGVKPSGALDRQVKEQMVAELDGLIRKHDP